VADFVSPWHRQNDVADKHLLWPHSPRARDDIALPKVYLRTLLFSTSKRGRVVESMHVALSRNEMHQNFNIWVYGEREKLVRGSGLFIGETGIAANQPLSHS
jgi:hypothetical protein